MKNIIKRAVVGLLAAALLSMPVWAATYNGIDIYHGDSNVNFSAVRNSGHGQFVYLKASQGTGYRDPMRATYAAEAQATSIPFGYYHYFMPDESGVAQANFFWNIIKNTGYTLVPSVDVEEVKNSSGVEYSPALIQSALRAFVDRFYALSGQKPMIYASTSYVDENIGSGFTDCPLWQAEYNSYPKSVAGWGNSRAVWQYGGGYVAGAGNDVDLDTAPDSRIFLTAQAVAQADSIPSAAVPSSNEQTASAADASDYYEVSSLPQVANSRAGTDFYIRDRYGNRIGNHQIDAGDPLIILGVDYATQLAEILYPNYAAGGWFHGYIKNAESQLHNTGYNGWENGRTNEPVYDASGARIGTIYPHERATIIGHVNGRTHVLYSTSKGSETKSGYVAYAGR